MSKSTIKWLLFDFDNTLVDFTNTAKKSLWRTFESYQRACTEEIYQLYKKINHQVWRDFEDGKITAEALRSKRFADLFKAIAIENISPTEFSQRFLENLVLCSEPYDGALELLTALKGKYKMSIVTNGLKEVQRPRLKRLGMMDFFDSIIVSDEIGSKKPQAEFFEYVFQTIPNPPAKSETLIIGDSLNSDIRGGRNFGIKTCWNSHNKKNGTKIKPNYVINNILELEELLHSI